MTPMPQSNEKVSKNALYTSAGQSMTPAWLRLRAVYLGSIGRITTLLQKYSRSIQEVTKKSRAPKEFRVSGLRLQSASEQPRTFRMRMWLFLGRGSRGYGVMPTFRTPKIDSIRMRTHLPQVACINRERNENHRSVTDQWHSIGEDRSIAYETQTHTKNATRAFKKLVVLQGIK